MNRAFHSVFYLNFENMCLWLGFPGLLSSRSRPVKHQSGPPRPSPKPSSKAEASRQEVALPSRAKTSQRWHMLFYERRPLTPLGAAVLARSAF